MKKITAFVMALLMVISFSACKNDERNSGAENAVDDKCLEEVAERKVIKVGIAASEEPPMAFVDDSYKIVGFDIDLANKIAEYIGNEYLPESKLKIQFNPIADSERAKALENGEADIILDGCVYGEDENMLYSNGYIKNRTVAVAEKEYVSTGELRSLNVAVMGGKKVFDALKAEGVEKITVFTSVDEMFAALKDGSADVLVLSELVYLYYMEENYGEEDKKSKESKESIIASDIGLEADIYAVGMKKEAKSLASAVNEALKSFDESGEKGELADKWFGSRDCLNLQEN